MGISQIRGYEPGDAEWGVKLDDVRGQAEAKEEIRRVVTLWQSGEVFEGAGGKRERGLLFLGAPGTGKTMLAKAIATGFNSPFVSIPGSGFAQTFIGIDAIIVRFLARKAKKLARKWGGQCIVFIDEIDAVGMRRQRARQRQQRRTMTRSTTATPQFYGPCGALNPSGDLIVETAAWRDRHVRAARAASRASPYPAWTQQGRQHRQPGHLPGRWAAWAAGSRSTSCSSRWTASTTRRSCAASSRTRSTRSSTRSTSSRAGSARSAASDPRRRALMRSPARSLLRRRPRSHARASPIVHALASRSIVWSAFLVALDVLIISADQRSGAQALGRRARVSLRLPARAADRRPDLLHRRDERADRDRSTRRSRARAAWAATSSSGRRRRKTARTSSTSTSTRSPTTPTSTRRERRDEIARITNGYSPAMIDQICSMALTNAHHEGRAPSPGSTSSTR